MENVIPIRPTEQTAYGTRDSFADAWNLYTDEQEETIAAGEDIGGPPSAAVQEALKAFYDDVKANLREKADEYIYIIKDAQAQEKALKVEAARLQARARQFVEKASKVKEFLKHAMETSDIKKLKTEKHTLNVQNPGGKAPIDIYTEESLLPDKYQVIKQVHSIDKDVLRTDLKAGIEVSGACLSTRETILIVK